MAIEKEVQIALNKASQDLQRTQIDLDKSSPFAEWAYREVEFPAADQEVTVRTGLHAKDGTLAILAVGWTFRTAPATAPAIYQLTSHHHSHPDHVHLCATVAGKALILFGVRRDA